MRCASCDARNPANAAWCTQCFAPFGRGQLDDAPPSVPRGTPPGPGGQGTPPAVAPDASSTGRARDVRERDGEVEWRCATCDGWVALAAPACAVCGTPRSGFTPGEHEVRSEVPAARAVAASIVLPGSGHLMLGAVGTGLARAGLAVLWLGGALMLLWGQGGGGLAVVLLLGAATLWGASAWDAAQLARGAGDEVLGGRRLGVLVLAVTLVLVAAVAVTAVRGPA